MLERGFKCSQCGNFCWSRALWRKFHMVPPSQTQQMQNLWWFAMWAKCSSAGFSSTIPLPPSPPPPNPGSDCPVAVFCCEADLLCVHLSLLHLLCVLSFQQQQKGNTSLPHCTDNTHTLSALVLTILLLKKKHGDPLTRWGNPLAPRIQSLVAAP